jgi:RimJ/RimL family protein N-acetyltransferase
MKNIISLIFTAAISISSCYALDGVLEPERMTASTSVPVALFTMHPITTKSLTIRRFEDSDFEIKDPKAHAFLTKIFTYDPTDLMDKEKNYPPIDQLEAFIQTPSNIQTLKDSLQSTTELRLGVFDSITGEHFGSICLSPAKFFNNSLEITQRYFTTSRSKGYGTEAKLGILKLLKEEIILHPEWNILYLESIIRSNNHVSLKLAEKTGSIRYRAHEDAKRARHHYYTPLT